MGDNFVDASQTLVMAPKSGSSEPKLQLAHLEEGGSFKQWAGGFIRLLQATGKPYYPVLLGRKVGGMEIPTDTAELRQLQSMLFHLLCEGTKHNMVTKQITAPYENRMLNLGADEADPSQEVAEIWKKFVTYFDGTADIDLHNALDKYDSFEYQDGESLQATISRFDELCIKLSTMYGRSVENDESTWITWMVSPTWERGVPFLDRTLCPIRGVNWTILGLHMWHHVLCVTHSTMW